MNYQLLLEKAIIQTVQELTSNNSNSIKGRIISSTGGENSGNVYKLSGLRIFETSIVEKLISNFFKLTNEEIFIGWESSYPRDDWGHSKLDIGIDYIDNSDYLFRIAIEVKKWFPDEYSIPYNIWYDIFKIIGYSHLENKEVGQKKYILLFCEYKENLDSLITKTFISYDYLLSIQNDPKYIDKFNKYKPSGDLNNIDHLFEFFITHELKWKSGVEFVINHLKKLKGQDKKSIFIKPYLFNGMSYYEKNNVAAVLLNIL